ncbi:MAG: prepilin-type N-terminal cleavage/methylation domain-containing protein [Patescibacteria group bacterium]
MKRKPSDQAGFGLIETLIAIGLTSILFLIIVSFLNASNLSRHAKFTVQATALAANEIEGLRNLDYNLLIDQTNAPFYTQLYTVGDWNTVSDTTRALSTGPAVGAGVTGLIKIPGDAQSVYTLEAKVKVLNSAPVGWRAGLAIKAKESNRYYRYVLRSNEILLEKVEPSGITVLSQTPYLISEDIWNTLKVIVSGNTFDLWLGAVNIDSSVIDNSAGWTSGDSGLITVGGPAVRFDDVKITNTVPETIIDEDFNAVDIGTRPESWQFLEPASLPSGSGTITIADYNGETNIKEVTATLTWQEVNNDRSVSLTSLISN